MAGTNLSYQRKWRKAHPGYCAQKNREYRAPDGRIPPRGGGRKEILGVRVWTRVLKILDKEKP